MGAERVPTRLNPEAIAAVLREAKVRNASLPAPEVRRAIRVALGLRQRDLAEVLGVDKATCSRWEAGVRNPRGRVRQDYAALLEALRRV
jgi:DNA-binding transcriptional regulator YiaG